MKQARDYRKYNVRLTSADWQRGSGRVINVVVQLIIKLEVPLRKGEVDAL